MSDSPLSTSNLAVHDAAATGERPNVPTRRDSMPDLQSVSNSSAASQPDAQVESIPLDDGDAMWQDEEPPIGSRRTRPGNDSGDSDRDRRHPSHRTNPLPPHAAQQHPAPPAHPHAHTQTANNLGGAGLNALFNGLINAVPGGTNFAQMGPGTPGGAMDLGQLFAMFGAAMPAAQPEQPDPERARLMLRALEPVPDGLVQRLQRLQELGQAEEGDSMCAICWDSLLSEGGGFTEDTPDAQDMQDVQGAPGGAEAERAPVPDDLPRMVTLPCTHTFHTGCLIPWFSRPQGTTCPTCRFNLDPTGDLTGRPQQQTNPGAAFDIFTGTGAMNPMGGGAVNFPHIHTAMGIIPIHPGGGQAHGQAPRPATQPTARRTTAPRPTRTPTLRRTTASQAQPTGSSVHPNNAQPPVSSGAPPLRASSSSATARASGSRNTTNTFNPSAVGLNSNSSTGLLRGFFDSVSRPANNPPAPTRTRPTQHRPSGSVDDGPPGLEPINPTEPAISVDPMDVDDASEETWGQDLPWLPTARPSPELEEELLREMSRAYATRMADLVFAEQRGGMFPQPFAQPTGIPHHHQHTWQQQGIQAAMAPPAGGAPVDFMDGSVDLVLDGIDQDGNSLARMSVRLTGGAPPGPPTPQGPGAPPTNPLGPVNMRSDHLLRNPHAAPRQQTQPNAPPGPPQPAQNIPTPTQAFVADLVRRTTGFTVDPGAIVINATTGDVQVPIGPPQPQAQQGGHLHGHPAPRPQQQRRQTATTAVDETRRRQRDWVPPEPTGSTFRQKVEQKERQAGLRCWESSCGVGPSDEEPIPDATALGTPQIRVKKKTTRVAAAEDSSSSSSSASAADKGKQKESSPTTPEFACNHSFHPACLVSMTRVAMSVKGGAAEPERDAETGEIEIGCPVCRVSGVIAGDEWDVGVRSLD